jgi:hypothetical protein
MRASFAMGGVLVLVVGILLALVAPAAAAQKSTWRPATDAELAALLPARAPVEKEHIETEMRTASGITDGKGRFIAGVVLITAGYSADGKYSHYLVVQSPVHVGGISLTPGEYVTSARRPASPTGRTRWARRRRSSSSKPTAPAWA